MKNRRNTFLLIDDRPENLISLRALINESFPGSEILIASDGAAGLELAREQEPDVVLLDILMPGIDGYEVCKCLKADAVLQEIPVVFVTALRSERQTRLKALESGGEAFLHKPIDAIELFAQLTVMLKLRESNLHKRSKLAAMQSDLNYRKEMEAKLKTVFNEYETVFQGTQAAMFLVEVIGENTFRYLRNNRAHAQASGLSTENLAGKTPQELTGAEQGENIAANYKRCVEAAAPISYEEVLKLPGGERTWYTTLTPIFQQDKITYLVGSSMDISARKQAEAEARRVKVLQAMENERMCLARDLHDEMGMLLLILKLDMQLFSHHITAAVPEVQERLQQSIVKITDAIAIVRRKSNALRSPEMDVLGLDDVLYDMVEEMNRKTGMQISLRIAPGMPPFRPEIKKTLYRCIQEALSNGARHSGALNMTIELNWTGEQVSCIITDDGIGFDADTVRHQCKGHLGLKGMEERVFLVKGKIAISTAPEQGTKITINIPL